MRPSSAHSGLRGPPLSLCDIMQRGYLQQVRMLVELGSNMEARDATGRTPLMLTAYVQPEGWGVGIARLLIESGVKMSARDRFGMHVLHHACVYERVELAKILLNALDFDMVQADKFGNTPLHYAAVSGNVPLIKLLLTYLLRYRLPLDKVNKQNRTALDEAVHNGHDVSAAIINSAINYNNGPASTRDDNQSVGKGDNDSVCESNAPFATSTEYSYCPPETSVKVAGAGEENNRSAFEKVDPLKQDFFFENKENKDASPLSSDRSSQGRTRRTGFRRPHTAVIKRPLSAGSSSSGSSAGGRAPHSSLLSLRNNNSGSSNNIQLQGIVTADSGSDVLTSSRKLTARNITSQNQRLRREGSTLLRAPSQQPLMPYDKDPERVIHVASETDFRNTPEYVLKLTRIYYDPRTFDTETLPAVIRRPPSVVRYDDQGDKKSAPTWRDEMRLLYRHYEIQCSQSWRNAARPPPDPISMLVSSCGTQGEETDEAGSARDSKKGRRASSGQRPDISTSSAVKRRPSSKQRKTSTTSPPSGPVRAAGASPDGMADVGMASSNESLSSATSVKKKDSLGARPDPAQAVAVGGAAGGVGAGAEGAKTSAAPSSRSQAKTSIDNGKGSGSESGSVPGSRGGSNAGVGVGSSPAAGGSANSAGGATSSSSSSSGTGSNGNASSGSATNGTVNGSGSAQARAGRRLGTSNSYTVPVPVLTATPATDDDHDNSVNSEPADIDSNRLSVIDEVL